MIETNLENLKLPVPITEEEIDKELINTLFKELAKNPAGYSLSANQIGINKRVGVINVEGNIKFFINPIINQLDYKTLYTESSISFPNTLLPTARFARVLLSCDNYETQWYGVQTEEIKNLNILSKGLATAVAIQQMVDHLDGILIFDRIFKNEPFIKEAEPERNEYIIIEKDGKTMTLKYKKAINYINEGWKIKHI